jgi:SAM-dependent methyltransferase
MGSQDFSAAVQQHYHRPDLYGEIVTRLTAMQVDMDKVSREDLAAVDEFHVRGAEVSRELAESLEIYNARVLDVGCGLGGSCRMLADAFGCTVTGIDLSEEFIITATKLSKLVGLEHKTEFIMGDATDLPFEEAAFEVVWTQHVQMNIQDKTKFYSEIARVLGKGGVFLYYDLFKKGDGKLSYPMPWAGVQELSFLRPVSQMEATLGRAGLRKEQSKDQTEAGILFFEKLFQKIRELGPPLLGLHLLMGESMPEKLTNLLNGLKSGILQLESGFYRK